MDEKEKIELKKQVLAEQMPHYWDFLSKSQERYNDGTRVIPDSVQEFSEVFFEGLEKVLRAI